MSEQIITIPRPHVPHGPVGIPEEEADARYLRDAVRNIEFRGNGERIWGSNLTATIIKLLQDCADAIERPDQQAPTADPMERVKELAYRQCAEWQKLIRTLPAGTRAHQLATTAFYVEAEWTRGRP